MIAEAVALKVTEEDRQAAKNTEKSAWKKDTKSLREKMNG